MTFGAVEMTHWLRAFAALAEIQVRFPDPTSNSQPLVRTISGGPTPSSGQAGTYTYLHIHINKIKSLRLTFHSRMLLWNFLIYSRKRAGIDVAMMGSLRLHLSPPTLTVCSIFPFVLELSHDAHDLPSQNLTG